MIPAELPPTEGVEVITDAVLATAAIEGVPEWVKYVVGTAGTLIVGPLVGVLVLYLRRRLGVEDGTHSLTPTPTPGAPSPGPTSPPIPDEEEQELDELRAALADVLVDLRQARALAAEEKKARERAEARAERLQSILEGMAERANRPPPTT